MADNKLPGITECCGCELCVNVCNKNALSMIRQDGFFIPTVDKSLCTNCNLCVKNCIVANPFEDGNGSKACFGAYYDDNTELLKSTSGGFAYALSLYVIKSGGVVYSVSLSDDAYYAQYIRCDSTDSLSKIRGTKYFPARKGSIYKSIKADLTSGLLVCMIGLPCEIAAAKRYVGRTDKFIGCELICHGPTSEDIHKEFVLDLEKKNNSKLCQINYRHKDGSWKNHKVKAEFVDGSAKLLDLSKTDFFTGFAYYLRNSCYKCHYKGQNSVSDITIGDFWGADTSSEFYNEAGVSSIVARTELGLRVIKSIDHLAIYDVSYEDVQKKNPRLDTSEELPKERKAYSFFYKFLGLKKTAKLIRFYWKIR